MIGIPIFGELQMTLSQFALVIVNTILIIIGYCSIFNFISMLCSEVTIATVISILIFIAMYVVCQSLTLTVNSNPYITNTFTDEQGNVSIIDSTPNPNYPSRLKMKVAKTIYFFIPMGQACELSNGDTENLELLPIYYIVFISSVNIVGMCLFNKKELK